MGTSGYVVTWWEPGAVCAQRSLPLGLGAALARRATLEAGGAFSVSVHRTDWGAWSRPEVLRAVFGTTFGLASR
jgi:hypothetical protein